jgi:hypothetical protein
VVAYDAAADRPRFGPDGLATLGRGRLAFAETAAWFAPWENLCHLGGDPDLLQEFVGFTTGPTGRYRSHASVLLIDQSRFLTGAEGSRSLATRDRVIAIGWSQLRAFAGAYELNAFLDRDALARGFHPDRATWYRAHQTHAAHAVGWFYDAIGSRPYRQRPTEAYRAVCARLGTMQIDDPPALLARYLGERAIGANALFRGDGVTSRADGSPGALEYLIVTRNDLRAHPDGSWVVVDASRRIEDPPTAT